jgi:hypothetical protein
MTMQTSSIVVPAPRRGPGRRLGLGLALGAVVAVAAGVGLWQSGRDSGTTEPAAPPTTAVERTVTPRSTVTGPTVYVVGSAEQAEAMQRAITEADNIRASLGETYLNESVLLVASAEDEAVLTMLAEQDAVRDQMGLPPIRIVDLRVPAASLPRVDAASYSDAEMYQRWLQAQGASAEGAVPMGGLAELIRDGGAPASAGVQAATVRSEAGVCGTTVGATFC